MHTLHVVSHTHWDREWYLTFQQFRFRLVQLVEGLLEILDDQPEYRSFMLDGQTIILEDVLDVCPDLESDLRRHIEAGKLLIGPWYILPDEFLVSPEALVRNLLLGVGICREWGGRMAVGYVPDPFGHIGQLPQLLRGFGIDTAVFSRGVGDMPVEFRWAAPDGSEVLVCYLRDHYDNVALLPGDGAGVAQALASARDSLAPHSATKHLLMMQGTDHMRPRAELGALLVEADALLPDRVLHSNLPEYVTGVKEKLGSDGLAGLPLHVGEMRDPSRANLLPGVLSTRMWIKQRNHACETLMERWAEPFTALAALVAGDGDLLAPHVKRAWRYLLENHPHDSICGCSVDQVHREMETRFDWCEQLGEEVVREALGTVAAQVDTTGAGGLAIVVFNPCASPRTDVVAAKVVPPVDPESVMMLDPDGRPVPFRVESHSFSSQTDMVFDRATMAQILDQARASGGVVWGEWRVRGLQVRIEDPVGHVSVTVTRGGPAAALPEEQAARLEAALKREDVEEYQVRIREDEALEVSFVARDVPPVGYASYRIAPSDAGPRQTQRAVEEAGAIENEFLCIEVDRDSGLLTIVDKETGLELRDCHRLVDGGDRGDEYNYCRPEHDVLVQEPHGAPKVRREVDEVGQRLVVEMLYRVPIGLVPDDRTKRSPELTELSVVTQISLLPGSRRVDFETTIENSAQDHRLRVHFPLPFAAEVAVAEGHWDVVELPLDLPTDTEGWAEQPQPTHPQRGWVSVSDGTRGVTLANRGLPEVEVVRGEEGAEVALTLLRCVGWLSREDMHCRKGHAGPGLPVPEAQCPGGHTFRYSLLIHTGDWRAGLAADEFQSDLRALVIDSRTGSLPSVMSFVRLEPDALRLSALKQPEEGEGMIVRLWNADEQPVEGTLKLWRSFRSVVRVGLDEQVGELGAPTELAADADTVQLSVGGREVVTLRFRF